MKKKITTIAMGLLFLNFNTSAQKTEIAVANPNVSGLYATPDIASKLIRFELMKIDTYSVYDEFDMQALYAKNEKFKENCLSKECLVELGETLHVDEVISGSYDLLAQKIIITLKLINIKSATIDKTIVREFDNQESELQRMTEITLKEMLGIEYDLVIANQLAFKNEVITSSNVGKINNSGPRIGAALLTGDLYEFATRDKANGGLGIFPVVSMIGYQVEGQYVGTENFSALGELIFNLSGLEQGYFNPSITLLNGFRFGKQNWEFAFGPGFGLKKTADVYIGTGAFGEEVGHYYTEREWNDNSFSGTPKFETMKFAGKYNRSPNYDLGISTSFLIAFGRTFKAGALNIPVNIFYSAKQGGGYAGVNMGFNVVKNKRKINK